MDPREAWASLHPKPELVPQAKGKCSALLDKIEELEKIVGCWGCSSSIPMQAYQPCALREGLWLDGAGRAEGAGEESSWADPACEGCNGKPQS